MKMKVVGLILILAAVLLLWVFNVGEIRHPVDKVEYGTDAFK